MGRMRAGVAVGAVAIALAVAGCSAQSEADEPTTPTASASVVDSTDDTAEPAAATPLEGTWRLEQTRQDVVKHLRDAGFGDLVRRFLRIEQTFAQDNWEWTFTGNEVQVAWQNPSGAWQSADSGTFEVVGDRAIFRFTNSGANVNTFRWKLDGDRLRLDWLEDDGGVVDGIPDEAYWRAYLTKPLVQVH